ncbi:hypothetical protein KR009_005430 [Drosophila setifemur]|nr:hypothetical protein KR009_005430 [Drosophila setifemur]
MNQFHTPSFGDEVFELNDSVQPAESPQQPGSRRMLSLDHSTFNDDAEEECHSFGAGQSLPVTQPLEQQQQLPSLPTPQQQQPAKPLAPFALFFRDTVTAIKQQNPSCSLEQMQVIVQTMWESLDEKQKSVYSQRHEQEKRDYVRLMRDYRQQLESTEESLAIAAAAPAPAPAPEEPMPVQEQLPPEVANQEAPPDQIQLLNEAATVQKCTREQCNKPAIINPDWEDEYCSNECVVIHCRNVFNEWALSLKSSPS